MRLRALHFLLASTLTMLSSSCEEKAAPDRSDDDGDAPRKRRKRKKTAAEDAGAKDAGAGDAEKVSEWKKGGEVDVSIVLVTSDFRNLACAMEDSVWGYRCAFRSRTESRVPVESARFDPFMLVPVTTDDRKQLLVGGLWIADALRSKLDREDFDKPSPRFTAKCRLRLLEKRTAEVQWKKGATWFPANDWWAGIATRCTIEGEATPSPGTAPPPRPRVSSGGLSCELARKKYIDTTPPGASVPQISAGTHGKLLNRGTYLNACGVPPTTAVSICAAVQNGRATGVTVELNPHDQKVAECVVAQIRGMSFPATPKMDITTTHFVAEK